jgi:hypothetical protein
MSQPESAPTPLTPRHYQIACGVALGVIFLLQMQAGLHMLLNVLMLVVGTLGILYRVRLSPLLVFLAMAGGHLAQQYERNQLFNPDFRGFRFLDVGDVLLCLAMLGYLLAHYRLQGLWFHVFPYDTRQGKTQARTEQSMTPAELFWLTMPLPFFAIAAELFMLFLRRPWDLVGLPSRWRQFLLMIWLLLVGMFVVAQFFRYWRRVQMDRATAQLLLQDMLWHETRGEQRRTNRWIVWRKLKDQKKVPQAPR